MDQISYAKILNAIYDKITPEIYKVAKLQQGDFKIYTPKNVHLTIHMNYKSYCNTEAYNKFD